MMTVYMFIVLTVFGHEPQRAAYVMPDPETCAQNVQGFLSNPPPPLRTIGGNIQASCVLHFDAPKALRMNKNRLVGGWIPPKRFDHKYYGKVIVKYVDEDEPHLIAYTYGDTGGFCVVYVNKRAAVQVPLKKILRHEIGHCNGWSERHER